MLAVLMTRTRRRELRAREAVTVLSYQAFIQIRASAFTGRVATARDFVPPDVDLREWIRLLADACHNLPGSLRPSVAHGRRHRSTDAMKYLWSTATPIQRDWIVATLSHHSVDVVELLGEQEPDQRPS